MFLRYLACYKFIPGVYDPYSPGFPDNLLTSLALFIGCSYTRQPHGECCPFTRLAVHVDMASMLLDDFVTDGQTHSATTLLGRVEWLEKFFDLALLHPRASVADRNSNGFLFESTGIQ